jgi:hypothetical protein
MIENRACPSASTADSRRKYLIQFGLVSPCSARNRSARFVDVANGDRIGDMLKHCVVHSEDSIGTT